MVIVVQLGKFPKNHRIVHLKWMAGRYDDLTGVSADAAHL